MSVASGKTEYLPFAKLFKLIGVIVVEINIEKRLKSHLEYDLAERLSRRLAQDVLIRQCHTYHTYKERMCLLIFEP